MPYPFWKVFLILHRLSVEMDVADELEQISKVSTVQGHGPIGQWLSWWLGCAERSGFSHQVVRTCCRLYRRSHVPELLDVLTGALLEMEFRGCFFNIWLNQEHSLLTSEGNWGRLMCVEFQTHLKIFHVQRYPPGHISATGQPDTCQSLPGASCSDGPWRIHEEIRGATGESQTVGRTGDDRVSWGHLLLATQNDLTNRGILAWSNSLRFEFPSKFSPETSKPMPLQVVCSSHLIQVRRWLGSPGSENANQKCIHKS